jgi:alginate O-acetyltransferase complex protein AlgI
MLFNSFTFAIFLPVVFLLYWFVFRRSLKQQNVLLVIASYVFYGWWDWRFLSLIFISSLADFMLGKAIHSSSDKIKRKTLLILSLAINLGMLGFFKYFNFFLDSLLAAMAQVGVELHPRTLNIVLPVGISFYTFQTLSYTIDIYRRKMTPTRDAVAFFAFVSFFPQLVAGPIERASHLLPQFLAKRNFDLAAAKDGLRQILWGLIKKVVIADTIALQVDHVFNQGDYSAMPGVTLLFAAILFAFQIYCDFSGYSDIAIGTARLFGFNLMRNFAYPFFSRNIAEFWQRWHISLSTWFRDYVFIPLGGSRVKLSIYIRNIIVTYALSGLWHGANWTFIIWGTLHAFFYLPLLLSPTKGKHHGIVAENRTFPSVKEVLQMLITFLMFTFSMIFFRSDNVGRTFDYYHSMAWNIVPDAGTLFEILISKNMIMILLLVMVEWIQRRKQHVLQIENLGTILRWTIYALAIAAFIYYGQFGSQKQFIYFQF